MPIRIDLIAIAMVPIIIAVVGIDLWKQGFAVAPSAASLSFAGAYAYLGLAFTLGMSFYSGPDPHGAPLAEISAVVVNFFLAAILVVILRSRRFSVFARRCVFYTFTFPGWLFLLRLARAGLGVH